MSCLGSPHLGGHRLSGRIGARSGRLKRPSRPATTGQDPLDPQRVLGAARMEPVAGQQATVRRSAERQVDDVDEGDPTLARQAGHRLVDGDDPVVLAARVAIVGAGRGHRVVGRRDGHDAVRPRPREERVEDHRDVRRVRPRRDAPDDVVDADEDGGEGRVQRRQRRQLGADDIARGVAVDRRGWRRAAGSARPARGPGPAGRASAPPEPRRSRSCTSRRAPRSASPLPPARPQIRTRSASSPRRTKVGFQRGGSTSSIRGARRSNEPNAMPSSSFASGAPRQ